MNVSKFFFFQYKREDLRRQDEHGYVFDAIVGHRTRDGNLEYLIKWKDLPETFNSWQPSENIKTSWSVFHYAKKTPPPGVVHAVRQVSHTTQS